MARDTVTPRTHAQLMQGTRKSQRTQAGVAIPTVVSMMVFGEMEDYVIVSWENGGSIPHLRARP